MTDEIPFHIQLVAPTSSLLAFAHPHVQHRIARTNASVFTPAPLPRQNTGASTFSAGAVSTASASQAFFANLRNLGTTRALARPTVRVYILRQITVEVRGQKAWRTCVLGEGSVSPSAPAASSSASPAYAQTQPPGRRQSTSSFSFAGRAARAARASASPSLELDPQSLNPVDALDWDGTVRVADPAGLQAGGFAAGNLVVKDFLVLSLIPPDPARSPLIEHQCAHPIRLVTDPLEDE